MGRCSARGGMCPLKRDALWLGAWRVRAGSVSVSSHVSNLSVNSDISESAVRKAPTAGRAESCGERRAKNVASRDPGGDDGEGSGCTSGRCQSPRVADAGRKNMACATPPTPRAARSRPKPGATADNTLHRVHRRRDIRSIRLPETRQLTSASGTEKSMTRSA